MANCCCLNKSKWKKKISSFIWHSKKSGGSSFFFFDTLDKQECKFFVFFLFFGLLDKIMRILINEFGEWWWTNQSNMHFQLKTGVSMNLKNSHTHTQTICIFCHLQIPFINCFCCQNYFNVAITCQSWEWMSIYSLYHDLWWWSWWNWNN